MKEFIKKNWFKLGVILLILIMGMISLFVYSSYRSEEISRQYRESAEKKEKENKEYLQKREDYCLKLFDDERERWNNVKSSRYDEFTDKCVITYKDEETWEGIDCDKFLATTTKNSFPSSYNISQYVSCEDKSFTKEFN